ncbi:WG repeat-containing protein [Leptospira semungkisensis]|nr:WG repeat-containing protein [Leptospira semungkisensis]
MRFSLFIVLVFGSILGGCSKNEPLVSFQENDLYGYKDKNGRIKIQAQYQQAYDFNENGVGFSFGKEGWVCIDPENRILLHPFPFENGPDYFSEGLARFVEGNKFGFFDPSCKKVISASYDFAHSIQQGFAIVCNGCSLVKEEEHSRIQGGKYGLIDTTGKAVIPLEYDSISEVDPSSGTVQATQGKLKKEIKLP